MFKRSFVRRSAACGAVSGGLVAVLLVMIAPAFAGTLEPRFSIGEGQTWTHSTLLSVGDDGWSPFFPPVVVRDGGSIVAGSGAELGFEFPTQTLALVPPA